MILNPQHLKIFGNNISIGDYATLITAPDKRIDLSTWETDKINGEINLGAYILISPGTSIRSAKKITIGESTMIASDVTITDSDWHGIYDRSEPVGNTKPVVLKDNVWIGDSAIVCKGVTIGENSIIGAGAVVTKDVPPNSIFAGNPAKLVKTLDEKKDSISRKDFFKDPKKLAADFDALDKYSLNKNTFFGWIQSIFWPDNTH